MLTALQFTLSALYNPAHSATLANVVKPDELVIANTLDGFTWSTMLALGALFGGVAAALFGVRVAFMIDAASFLVSVAFVSRSAIGYAVPLWGRSRGGAGRLSGFSGWFALPQTPSLAAGISAGRGRRQPHFVRY